MTFEPKSLAVSNLSISLAEVENARLYSIAEYEGTAQPLSLYLKNISWEKVLAWHTGLWQKEFIRAARHFVRNNNGCWAGKKFCLQEPELGTSTYKAALPIPTPANLAQRKLNHSLAFFREVHASMSARELAAAFDERTHLAERLRDASFLLTNTTAGRILTKWEPSWALKTVLKTQGRHPIMQLPEPGEVGELLARIEHFWHCWNTFHEAEQLPYSATTRATGSLPILLEVGSATPTPPGSTINEGGPVLNPADRILGAGFTLDEVDRLAHTVGLTDEAGHYCLGPRKWGAVVGFCKALKQAGKLDGALAKLIAVIGPRFGIEVRTRKSSTSIAQRYFAMTSKALTRLKKTD